MNNYHNYPDRTHYKDISTKKMWFKKDNHWHFHGIDYNHNFMYTCCKDDKNEECSIDCIKIELPKDKK